MRNRVRVALTISLVYLLVTPKTVNAVEKPIIDSFTASRTDVDILDQNLDILFELTVSHPNGIENRFVTLRLTNNDTFSISTQMTRIDKLVNQESKKAVFQATLSIPRNFTPGVYEYSVDNITSGVSKLATSSGLGIAKVDTGIIVGPVLRTLKGAESGILIRNNGYLDLNYQTINGPAYGPQSGNSYIDNTKYSVTAPPIWKVNELIDLSNYFELAITDSKLIVDSTTPKICSPSGTKLKLLSVGDCSFTVSTDRTKDYLPKIVNQAQSISESRKQSVLFIEKMPNLQAKDLPITLELPKVYSSGLSNVEYVLPKSITQNICNVAGYILKIFSGGTCSLIYKSDGNLNYLPSDPYTQNINIEKQNQTISFEPPKIIELSKKSLVLNASATSGSPVVFTSNTPEICRLNLSTLILLEGGNCSLTAIQSGTPDFNEISKDLEIKIIGSSSPQFKKIVCVKGKIKKNVSGLNPKCQVGFKERKG